MEEDLEGSDAEIRNFGESNRSLVSEPTVNGQPEMPSSSSDLKSLIEESDEDADDPEGYNFESSEDEHEARRGDLHKSLPSTSIQTNKPNMKMEENEAKYIVEEKVILSKDNIKHGLKKFIVDCDICGKRLSSNRRLQEHIKVVHEKVKDYFCDQCSKAFGDPALLKSHQARVHSKVREFICNICQKEWLTKAELVNHMRTHTGEKPFVCEVCSKGFVYKQDLQAHRRTHDGFKHTCEHCGAEFTYAKGLNQHMKYKHLGFHDNYLERRRLLKEKRGILVKPRGQKTEKDLTCHECGATFPKMNRLKRHMATHTKSNSGINIMDHAVLLEDGKRVMCKECGKEISCMRNLKEHVLMIHYGHYKTDTPGHFKNENPVVQPKEDDKNLINYSESQMEFLKTLMSEFGGKSLVQVMDFVRSLKDTDEEQLDFIIKSCAITPCRDLFASLGVIEVKNDPSTKPESSGESWVAQKMEMKLVEDSEAKQEVSNDVKEEPEEKDDEGEIHFTADGEEVNYSLEDTDSDSEEDDDDEWEWKSFGPENLKKEEIKDASMISDNNSPVKLETEEPVEKRPKRERRHYCGSKESCTCVICGLVMPVGFELKRHIAVHLYTTLNVSDKVKKLDDGKKVSCMDCGKEFARLKNLKEHIINAHHGDQSNMLIEASKSTKLLPSVQALMKDALTVPEKRTDFTCETCGNTFLDIHRLKRHYVTHMEVKPYSCPHCGMTFTASSTQKAHINTVHLGLREFKCTECDAEYTTKANLKIHIMSRHRNDKPHVCTVCGHKFACKKNLQKHEYTHNPELRPKKSEQRFQCEECGKDYTTRPVLQKHVEVVHMGLKKHDCSFCGKAFGRLSSLNVHLLIHTGQQRSL